MGLRTAIFEMKEAIKYHEERKLEEDFIHELEASNHLRNGSLLYYFNFFMKMSMKNNENIGQSDEDYKKINRKWTKDEIDFMFHYISERQEEGALNITEILDEVAQALDRGYQSVNYKYYSSMKARNKVQAVISKNSHITTISEERIPVLATEVIRDLPPSPPVSQQSSLQDDDLLDILSGLITNVQKLPGINLNELLKSLYLLTNMALQNQEAANKVETIKSEMSLERESSREKLRKMEQQLLREKKRNDELQLEVAKLAEEIMAFNQLGDAAKIQNLKSYNQRLNYIIDSFGVVLKVGG